MIPQNHPLDSLKTPFFIGSVFTAACSGECIIQVGVMTGRNSDGLPFDVPEARALLERYGNILGAGGFGGE
jgi:hypothetical protein